MIASTLNIHLAVFLAGCFLFTDAGYGAARERGTRHAANLDVQPSPEIEERIADEVAQAERILHQLDATNFLASPYLVSAIYYHDDFLTDFPVDRREADPERRVIGKISQALTPELKVHFVRLLHQVWDHNSSHGPARSVVPVNFTASAGGRRSHKYAIDLFAPEGAPVYSVSRGIVVLADRDWSPDNLFSTTSRKGGNAVIVFDPDKDRFYRFCHLSAVLVSSGEIVQSGQIIGRVGHSGLNASRTGHGQHLHFEANEYSDGHVRAIDHRRLRSMLQQWRAQS